MNKTVIPLLLLLLLLQYMFSALKDCVPQMHLSRHLESPQSLTEAFDKEIMKNVTEVIFVAHSY